MENEKSRIFNSLSVLHRHGMIYLKRLFDSTGAKECHPPFLFMISEHEGITQEDLAKHAKFDKGALTRIIKNMEENGYIRKEQDPNDKRKKHIYLTEKGKSTIPFLRETSKRYESTITKGMTKEQINVLQGLLEKASENILEETRNISEECNLGCSRDKPKRNSIRKRGKKETQ